MGWLLNYKSKPMRHVYVTAAWAPSQGNVARLPGKLGYILHNPNGGDSNFVTVLLHSSQLIELNLMWTLQLEDSTQEKKAWDSAKSCTKNPAPRKAHYWLFSISGEMIILVWSRPPFLITTLTQEREIWHENNFATTERVCSAHVLKSPRQPAIARTRVPVSEACENSQSQGGFELNPNDPGLNMCRASGVSTWSLPFATQS